MPPETKALPSIDDKVVIRDQNGIWKPAKVLSVEDDGSFVAEWVLSAGADCIKVDVRSAIAWRLADAPVPA